MLEQFNVSVVIPVYKARLYIQESVESALNHDCVKEVILVEDGSKDGTLNECILLSYKYLLPLVFTYLLEKYLSILSENELISELE